MTPSAGLIDPEPGVKPSNQNSLEGGKAFADGKNPLYSGFPRNTQDTEERKVPAGFVPSAFSSGYPVE